MRKKNIKLKFLVALLLINCFVLPLINSSLESLVFASGSGMEEDYQAGEKVIRVYDDFEDGLLDTSIWEANSRFVEANGRITSRPGLGKLELKGDYSGYDSYSISVDLVDIGGQDWELSNGGVGISNDDYTWVYNERLKFRIDNWGRKTKDTARFLYLTNYGSINSYYGKYGEYIVSEQLEPWARVKAKKREDPIRITIEATKKGINVYKIDVQVYKLNTGNAVLMDSYTWENQHFDFREICLAAVEPNYRWYVSFDNFSLEGRKVLFDTLKATWRDDVYTLAWEPVENAIDYEAYYLSDYGERFVTWIDAAASKKIFINDTVAAYPYEVRAGLGYDVPSNKVYLNGNIGDPFEISGSYVGDNYKLSWDALDIAGNPDYTYSLYYGDSESSIDKLVEGASDLDKSTLEHTMSNLGATSKYYGKYLQLVAKVNNGIYGHTDFYSNKIQVKSDLRLGANAIGDYFIFTWLKEDRFKEYTLYRDADKDNLKAPAGQGIAHDSIDFNKVTVVGDTVYMKKSALDTGYLNKYFVLSAMDGTNRFYSNIIRMTNNTDKPSLSWSQDASNIQLQWSPLAGASKVELYSGDSVTDINTLVTTDLDLSQTTSISLVKNDYKNKYIRARFFKDDVWHYSDIITTVAIETLESKIGLAPSNDGKYDFVLDWSDIIWPKKNEGSAAIQSTYSLYYKNDQGQAISIKENLAESNYTIEDIYGDKKDLLGKEIFLRVSRSATDQYGIDYSLVLESEHYIPKKLKFDGLEGKFDDDSNYNLSWEKPLELDVDEQTLTVSSYELKYGPSKLLTDRTLIGLTSPLAVTHSLADVAEEGTGKNYYHKFFNVFATINNICYTSNTVYSGETIELRAERFSDDFTLLWAINNNADAVEAYYADSEDGDYNIYEPANLGGASNKLLIEDLDDTNKQYNNKYFKIAAEFDGHKIYSNAIKLNVTDGLPSIEGEYVVGDDFKVTWDALDWTVDDYVLYYEKKETEDDQTTISYEEVVGYNLSNSSGKYTATINNVSSTIYNNQRVLIAAETEFLKVYSNAVRVEDPTIKGQMEGIFAEDNVNLKVGNRKEMVYNFKVYKDMMLPYIKIEFFGSKYLMFDKISASLEKEEGGTRSLIDISLVTEFDEETGNTVVLVHPAEENAKFDANSAITYKLMVNAAITVNDKYETEVYKALKDLGDNKGETLKSWMLPYYIADLQVKGKAIDENLSVGYKVYWNTDNSPSTGDQRQTYQELFNIDIDVKNKNNLPGSM